MVSYDSENFLLPKFPRTRHLPIDPNATRDDLILSTKEMDTVLSSGRTFIEEKVDGANCGVTIHPETGEPVIRNRNHILNKAYGRKGTPAKLQFAPLWNWYYNHADKIHKLADWLGFMPSIYGEWLYARHSVVYDELADYFIAFDVYDPHRRIFLNPDVWTDFANLAGFKTIPRIAVGNFNADDLRDIRDGLSAYSSVNLREGVYGKVCDDERVLYRFKMVRPDFITDDHWNTKPLVKNKLERT